MKKNVAAEVKNKIAELKSNKNAELAKISAELTAARTEKAEQHHALKNATEATNFEMYEKAKAGISKAETKIEMLEARYSQIERREYLTEKESDAVIDSLKKYENDLAAEYTKAIAEPLATLAKLTADYKAAVADTESTINVWTAEIHANYRSECTIYANGTNRSDRPVPVRQLRFEGIPTSELIETLVKNPTIKQLIGKE